MHLLSYCVSPGYNYNGTLKMSPMAHPPSVAHNLCSVMIPKSHPHPADTQRKASVHSQMLPDVDNKTVYKEITCT